MANQQRVTKALTAALDGLELAPADGAATQLARTYASQLDDGGDLGKLGPQLLAVLESLGMTPRARAGIVKGGPARESASSPLDELRERRRARQRDPATVDATAS